MNIKQKNIVTDILTAVRDNDIMSSGTKRSLTATIKKVEAGAITDIDGVKAALNATADKATDTDDVKTLQGTSKHIARQIGTQPAVKRATAVKATKATGTKAKTVRGAQKPAEGITETIPVPSADSLSEGTADHALYSAVDAFLVANDSAPMYNDGPDGLSASFEFDSWVYRLWAPKFNSAGPEDGWRVVYTAVDDDSNVTDVSEDLSTTDKLIKWLAEDTGFKIPAKKRAAKATGAAAKSSGVAIVNVSAISPLLSAAFVSAKAAQDIAQQIGGYDEATMKALADFVTAAADLRKVMAPIN